MSARRGRARRTGRWRAILAAFAVANALVYAVQALFVVPVRVQSDSMRPRVERGDILLVKRDTDVPGRAQLVIFRSSELDSPRADDLPRLLVKRVIGLPGEKIEAHDGILAIDDRRVEERWLGGASSSPLEIASTEIPDDSIYVLGDNRGDSSDSRVFGPVPLDALVGTASARIWPTSKLQSFS